MRLFNSESPKRHVIYANSFHVRELGMMGKLKGWKANNNAATKPCRSYIDKMGLRRFCGTKFLKKTEIFSSTL